jgi:hypothetical protein
MSIKKYPNICNRCSGNPMNPATAGPGLISIKNSKIVKEIHFNNYKIEPHKRYELKAGG